MTPRLLLHIGYHKTATTWMQTRLLQPVHGFAQLASHEEIFLRVGQPHGLQFSPEPMQSLIAARLKDLAPTHVPVISSEVLSGHPFFGGRGSDVYAHRLKAIAPQARILISIRSQLKILPSVYMQYIQRGGTMSAARFFKGTDVPGFFGFRAEHFEYHRLIGLYRDLFGAESVHVMTQESLQQDQEKACADLAAFCEAKDYTGLSAQARAPHGLSYPEYAAPLLRRINQTQRSPMTPAPALPFGETPNLLYRGTGYVLRQPRIKRLLRDARPVSAYVKDHFAGRFDDSNRALAQMLGDQVDLSRYEGADPT